VAKKLITPGIFVVATAILSAIVSMAPGSNRALTVISLIFSINAGITYLLYEHANRRAEKSDDLIEKTRNDLQRLINIKSLNDEFLERELGKIIRSYGEIIASPKRLFFEKAARDNIEMLATVLNSLSIGEIREISLDTSARWVGWCFQTVDREVLALDTKGFDAFWETRVGKDYKLDYREVLKRGVPFTCIFIIHDAKELQISRPEIERQKAEGVICYVVFQEDIPAQDDSNICIYHCSSYSTWVSWVEADNTGRLGKWNASVLQRQVENITRQYDRVRSAALPWGDPGIDERYRPKIDARIP
jgi:hypothetical protein